MHLYYLCICFLQGMFLTDYKTKISIILQIKVLQNLTDRNRKLYTSLQYQWFVAQILKIFGWNWFQLESSVMYRCVCLFASLVGVDLFHKSIISCGWWYKTNMTSIPQIQTIKQIQHVPNCLSAEFHLILNPRNMSEDDDKLREWKSWLPYKLVRSLEKTNYIRGSFQPK